MCFGQTEFGYMKPTEDNPAIGPTKTFKPNKFGSFAQGVAGGYNETGFAPTTKMGKLGAIIGAMTRGGFDAWGPGDIGTGFQRAEEKSMNRDYYRQQMQRQKIADKMREEQIGVQQGRLDVSRQSAEALDMLRRAQALKAAYEAAAPAKINEKLITGENDPMAGNVVSEQGGKVIGTRPELIEPEQVGLPPLSIPSGPGVRPKMSLPSYYESEREKKSTASRPTVVTARDASGTEIPYIIDTNPASPSFSKKMGDMGGIKRAPPPDKAGAKAAQEQEFADAADSLMSGFGGDAAKAEDAVRGAKTYSATEKEGIIRHIRKQAPRAGGKRSGALGRLLTAP